MKPPTGYFFQFNLFFISSYPQYSNLVIESFWLRINDSKYQYRWMVDKWGYEKGPGSDEDATFFNWRNGFLL
jgi:hypothetical protein